MYFILLQVRAAAGQKDSLKRQVRRLKKGNNPTEPASISTIPHPLPVQYTKTSPEDDRQFLIYDNGSESNRVLVFSSDIGLQLLAEADTWFMDGTHSTCPTQFQQLFSVRVPLGNSHVSAVYALLPSKLQSTYEECLTSILDTCLQNNQRPNPSTVVIDYEVAIHNAVRSVVSPNIRIQGCFYHLTQSTWRRVQAEGLQSRYADDEETRDSVGMIDGLAFLPIDCVKDGMSVLQEVVPDHLRGLLEYFDGNYVSGCYRSVLGSSGVMRFRRTPPRFELQTWNVHDATMSDQHRTNNVCESWNNGFKSLVGHSNPSLWTVIQSLQKDCAMVETDHYKFEHGEPVSKRVKKATIVHQNRLKLLCQQQLKGEKSLSEFLYAIGKCIRLK